MQRIFFSVSVFFILGCIPAFPSEMVKKRGDDGITSVTIQSLFPLSSDLTWRYERTSREGVSHYTTRYMGTLAKDNEILHILGNPFGASYYSSNPEFLKIRGMSQVEDIKEVDFYQEGDIIRLKSPIRQGTRWQCRAIMEKNEDLIITAYDTEILGWENTNVPAGNFDSIVTSSTQHTVFIKKESGQGKGMFTFEQVWYSPGIGMVRRDMYLLYPGDIQLPFRDDKLEEFFREGKGKD
jgi:hypothetical protein